MVHPASRPTNDWRHLHLDVTNQALNEPQEDSTYAASVGANYTIPLLPQYSIAAQIGGDVTFREKGTEYDVTTGIFKRGLKLNDSFELGGALLLDYRHTQRDGNIFGVRPSVGVDIGEDDSFGVEGVLPLDSETVARTPTMKIVQEMVRRVDAHWGHDWTQELATEFSGGYMFGEIDSPVVGAQGAYALHPSINLALIGEINFEGDYAAGISVVFDLSSSGRPSTVRRYGSKQGLVPFTKRSFPFMVTELSEEGNPPVIMSTPIPDPGGDTTPNLPPGFDGGVIQ